MKSKHIESCCGVPVAHIERRSLHQMKLWEEEGLMKLRRLVVEERWSLQAEIRSAQQKKTSGCETN